MEAAQEALEIAHAELEALQAAQAEGEGKDDSPEKEEEEEEVAPEKV